MKGSVLQKCNERSDSLADTVRIRLSTSNSDLHTADAQYHKDGNGNC